MNVNRRTGFYVIFVILIATLTISILQRKTPQYGVSAPPDRPKQSLASTSNGGLDERFSIRQPSPPPYLSRIRHDQQKSGKYIVKGRIWSGQNETIAEATISIYSEKTKASLVECPAPLIMQSSDTYGNFEINLESPLQNGYIKIAKQGYTTVADALSIVVPGTVIRNYILPAAVACIKGSISDVNGSPVANARITLSSAEHEFSINSDIFPDEAISDSAGNFMISGLPAGSIWISASVPHYVRDIERITLVKGPCEHIAIHLRQGKTIRLSVRSQSNFAIPDAKFSFRYSNTGNSSRVQVIESGIFEWIAPLDATPVDCTIQAIGYEDKVLTLNPNLTQIEIMLDAAQPFYGRVLSTSGDPISEAHVMVVGAGEVDTGADGTFSVSVSRPPIQFISVKKSGFAEQRLNYGKKGAKSGLEIRMSPTDCGFYGRILDEAEQPVTRGRITVYELTPTGAPGNAQFSRTFDSEEGRFTVVDIAPGDYSVRVETYSGVLKTGVLPKLEVRSGTRYGEIIIHVSPIKGQKVPTICAVER